jgi:hypothetical protein
MQTLESVLSVWESGKWEGAGGHIVVAASVSCLLTGLVD